MLCPCYNRRTVLTKTQNWPKRAETRQKEPKPAKTTKKIAKRPETTQNFKTGEIWNFLLAFVFQISSKNAQIWPF